MLMRRRLIGPLVEAWFDLLPEGQRPLARELHAAILALAPGLDQSVRRGHLVYGVGRQHVLALAPHRQHLHLQVFAGTALKAGFPMLERVGAGVHQLRLRYAQPVDDRLIGALLAAAVNAVPAGRSEVSPSGAGAGSDSEDSE